MSSITQSVQNYGTGGISEQPDHMKYPGQVKNVVNAIPDITYGLFKRPGSKRIGTTPLTYVGSGGSWFHYYRDETEGSYIGQVQSDGTVCVWRCSDGTKMTTRYGVELFLSTKAYKKGDRIQNADQVFEADADIAAGNSAPTHTSAGTVNNWVWIETTAVSDARVKTYLTPSTVDDVSQTEDLQFLTINDTTFVNNRSITVTTTGTTDTRPDTNFAFVDLLKSENGRQYGMNIYSGTGTTDITTATVLEISDDDLSEAGGTGNCPGIGTQIFVVNSGSKQNLIFRITTIGQQGANPGANEQDDHGEFCCSYNRKVQLLHGGEGWAKNDTTDVTLTNARGGAGAGGSNSKATYTVKVLESETASVKADIKAVRPIPTTFDAQTSVTVDAILGGIKRHIPSPLTATIIGNGIYFSSPNKFQIEICEPDLMRVMQSSVDSISDLPGQCKHGYIVKVSNAQESDEDDYYLKFQGHNDTDGQGSWSECAEPGIVKGFDNTTMPHVIQRVSSTEFVVKAFNYPDRTVGDNTTNPIPNFVGKTINKVLFFRNRLAFLSGEYVVTCRPGTLGTPNFWSDTALAVSNVDPIDITSSSMFPSDLYDGIDINAGLLVFSTNQQFLLSSDDTAINPDTAKLRSVATYNYNKTIPPISMGMTVGYLDNSGQYSRFNEMANTAREGEPTVMEMSRLVPSILPKDIDLLTNSRENSIVLFGKTGSDEIIGYKYFIVGDKRQQSSWFRWKLNTPIKYHFIIDDTYFFLDHNNFLQSINLLQSSTDISIDQDGINYLLHLDNHTTITGGVFDIAADKTTFTHNSGGCIFNWQGSVTSPNGTLVLIDSDDTLTRVGRYAEVTVTSTGSTFTVPGDWSGITVNIGYLYEYKVEFPRVYVTKDAGGGRTRADVNGSLVVHRVHINFGKIGLYETTLSRVGKTDYTEIYESTDLDAYDASDAPYLEEKIQTVPVYEKNSNVDIVLKSSHPSPATLHGMSWEGDYNFKYYRRV